MTVAYQPRPGLFTGPRRSELIFASVGRLSDISFQPQRKFNHPYSNK